MGERGGELASGGEAFGLLHLVNLVPELTVDLFELEGGVDESAALFAFAVGDGASDDAGDTEDGELDHLILGVKRPGVPVTNDGGGLHDGSEENRGEGAAPAEEQAGKQEGQDVHVVQDVVRFDVSGRNDPGDDGERQDEEREERGADAGARLHGGGAGHAVILPCERWGMMRRAAQEGRRWRRQEEVGVATHAGCYASEWPPHGGTLEKVLCAAGKLLHDMGQPTGEAYANGTVRAEPRGRRADLLGNMVVGKMVSDVQSPLA